MFKKVLVIIAFVTTLFTSTISLEARDYGDEIKNLEKQIEALEAESDYMEDLDYNKEVYKDVTISVEYIKNIDMFLSRMCCKFKFENVWHDCKIVLISTDADGWEVTFGNIWVDGEVIATYDMEEDEFIYTPIGEKYIDVLEGC